MPKWPAGHDEILDRYPSATHPHQSSMAHTMTVEYVDAIDATAGAILRSVDWQVLQ
jgi:hypothetical protein